MSTLFAVRTWRVSDLPAWIRPNVTVDAVSGCFRVGPGNGIWHSDGYAKAGITGVHRIVYMECVGEIPDETPVIDHVRAWGCLWRDCCRPDHLQPVTVRENTLRGDTFAAANVAKTACSTCGTPYAGPNLYVYPDGRRDCRACRADARERYVERQAIAAANAAGYLFELPRAA